MTAVLVLDFDGTLTDAEREGLPFVEGYLEALDAMVGATDAAARARVRAIADETKARLFAAPAEAGYVVDGKMVAPASVDPYLRIVPMAGAVLDAFGVLPDRAARAAALAPLFAPNYARTVEHPVFRPEARALVRALRPFADRVHVVTNSGTSHVRRKIELLAAGDPELAWLADHVNGEASKFLVEDGWTDGPADLHLPGLARPVLTRRYIYFTKLARILGARGFDDLVVAGDIFELDLSLPFALGARVVLRRNERTPDYEIAYLHANPARAHVLDDLSALPALVFAA